MSAAGDGLRFFDLRTLEQMGGWKTNPLSEVSSFIVDGKCYFLFG